eukprot:Cvel_25659.t1-p1 / transcript=Cvel_25659.t1 / gene=Cvel_25659 / organism=Chromera_velia_CCMP2878 / gene_product=hypothetical protein / transcript_product=hypothetical protein / location=Cvel_scaffold2938:15336-21873(+) / protein_length=891 / sequence_SO=supercontig / SO=protein_coding / is_pseudo=false
MAVAVKEEEVAPPLENWREMGRQIFKKCKWFDWEREFCKVVFVPSKDQYEDAVRHFEELVQSAHLNEVGFAVESVLRWRLLSRLQSEARTGVPDPPHTRRLCKKLTGEEEDVIIEHAWNLGGAVPRIADPYGGEKEEAFLVLPFNVARHTRKDFPRRDHVRSPVQNPDQFLKDLDSTGLHAEQTGQLRKLLSFCESVECRPHYNAMNLRIFARLVPEVANDINFPATPFGEEPPPSPHPAHRTGKRLRSLPKKVHRGGMDNRKDPSIKSLWPLQEEAVDFVKERLGGYPRENSRMHSGTICVASDKAARTGRSVGFDPFDRYLISVAVPILFPYGVCESADEKKSYSTFWKETLRAQLLAAIGDAFPNSQASQIVVKKEEDDSEGGDSDSRGGSNRQLLFTWKQLLADGVIDPDSFKVEIGEITQESRADQQSEDFMVVQATFDLQWNRELMRPWTREREGKVTIPKEVPAEGEQGEQPLVVVCTQDFNREHLFLPVKRLLERVLKSNALASVARNAGFHEPLPNVIRPRRGLGNQRGTNGATGEVFVPPGPFLYPHQSFPTEALKKYKEHCQSQSPLTELFESASSEGELESGGSGIPSTVQILVACTYTLEPQAKDFPISVLKRCGVEMSDVLRDLCTHTRDVALDSTDGGRLSIPIREDCNAESLRRWDATQEASWVGVLDPEMCQQRLLGGQESDSVVVGPPDERGGSSFGGSRSSHSAASASGNNSISPSADLAFRGWLQVSVRSRSIPKETAGGGSNSPTRKGPKKKKGGKDGKDDEGSATGEGTNNGGNMGGWGGGRSGKGARGGSSVGGRGGSDGGDRGGSGGVHGNDHQTAESQGEGKPQTEDEHRQNRLGRVTRRRATKRNVGKFQCTRKTPAAFLMMKQF